MSEAIGIDLGTTNPAVAVLRGTELKIVANPEGNRITPSVVSFKDGEVIVSNVARRQAVTNPDTVISTKSKTSTSEEAPANGKEYALQEISAMILQYLKGHAENYPDGKVTKAVITVPAHFNDAQRQTVKDVGKIAGLEVKRVVNRPAAATFVYGPDKTDKDRKILVFDLGGGTFDVSILELGDDVFDILTTTGGNKLGDDDSNQEIVNWLVAGSRSGNGIDLSQDEMAPQRLRSVAEETKKNFSNVTQTQISLPFITTEVAGPLHLEVSLIRAKFDDLTRGLAERTKTPVRRALPDAGLSISEIDEVILVGDSTRIPTVVGTVKTGTGKEPDKSVNPDEVAAMGAAIQGGVITGDVKNVVLLDVTPLSFGIETMGGVFIKLIDRNTTIPTPKPQVFSTAADSQPAVNIHVLQGERPMAVDNKTLGRLQLIDIPATPRGIPQIEVTFDIGKNGTVSVKAKDLGTQREQHIIIQSNFSLADEKIERMMKDVEANAEADVKRREEVDPRNEVDQAIFATEKTIREAEDKDFDTEHDITQSAPNELKAVQETNNFEDMKAKLKALNEKAQTLVAKLHEQTAAVQQTQADAKSVQSTDSSNNSDDVVDGEFTGK